MREWVMAIVVARVEESGGGIPKWESGGEETETVSSTDGRSDGRCYHQDGDCTLLARGGGKRSHPLLEAAVAPEGDQTLTLGRVCPVLHRP